MERPPKTDPTVKILLGLITVALFANLLRPTLAPALAAPATAPPPPSGAPVLAMEPGVNEAIVVQNSTVYEVDFQNELKIRSQVRLK